MHYLMNTCMSSWWCGVRWAELYQVNLKWLNRKWEHTNNEGNYFDPRHSILKIDLAMYSSHGGWWGSARKGNKSLLHNILTLTHFGVINQAPVHSVPPPLHPSSVIANAVHITGACQFCLLFIDSSSAAWRGLRSQLPFFMNTFSWIY